MYLIYKHTNKINGKSYIGLTSLSLEERLQGHINDVKYGSDRKFHQAIRKYGIENFHSEVLENNIQTYEKACEREIFWIKELETFYITNKGYNMTEGGDGSPKGKLNANFGRKRPEHSKYMKEKHKVEGHWAKNLEKEENPNFGSKRTNEQKKRIKESINKIENLKCPHCGKEGNPGNMKRWHFDNCGKQNTNKKLMVKIELYSKEGLIQIFDNAKEFAEKYPCSLLKCKEPYIWKKGNSNKMKRFDGYYIIKK